MSATISNLTPAPVRRRGNGCGDARRGGRDGGGVRRIYHLSSRLTVLPFSAGLCACLRTGETRARLGAVARRVVVVRCRTRRGLPGQTLAFSRTAPVLRHQGCRTLVSPWRRPAPGSAAVAASSSLCVFPRCEARFAPSISEAWVPLARSLSGVGARVLLAVSPDPPNAGPG